MLIVSVALACPRREMMVNSIELDTLRSFRMRFMALDRDSLNSDGQKQNVQKNYLM